MKKFFTFLISVCSLLVVSCSKGDNKINGSGFKPYKEGWQHFTVKVNQTIIDSSNTSNQIIDSESNIAKVDCVLKMPLTYSTTGKPSKLLMICHGSGRGVYGGDVSWITTKDYNKLINTFVNAGYFVFDCNGYNNNREGYDFWGCPRGVEAWRKAYSYILKNYNVEKTFSIYAFSMGGLTGLNLVMSDFPNVKCLALGSPVTTLDEEVCNRSEGYLLTAYGLTEWDPDSPNLIGSDPMKNIVEVDGIDYCFKTLPPMKVWFGGNEVWPSPTLAQKLVNSIKNSGGIADFRLVEGKGHEICYGANSTINKEYLYFINRF